MSRIVWLKDGRKCKLISGDKETGYVVELYAVFFNYNPENPDCEDDGFEMTSGKLEKADVIYGAPPVDVIDAECRTILQSGEKLQKQYDDLMKDYALLTRSYEQMKGYKTDLSRFIINREELKTAKRLIAWPKDKIAPRIMGGIKGQKFVISYTIDQWGQDEQRCWLHEASTEQRYSENSYSSYSEYYDGQYGIKCDLTDDEILAITHERQANGKMSDYAIQNTPDLWLTPENIEKKKNIMADDKVKAIQAAENELERARIKLQNLTGHGER